MKTRVTSLLAGDVTDFGVVKTVAALNRRGTRYAVVFANADGETSHEFSRLEELELKQTTQDTRV